MQAPLNEYKNLSCQSPYLAALWSRRLVVRFESFFRYFGKQWSAFQPVVVEGLFVTGYSRCWKSAMRATAVHCSPHSVERQVQFPLNCSLKSTPCRIPREFSKSQLIFQPHSSLFCQVSLWFSLLSAVSLSCFETRPEIFKAAPVLVQKLTQCHTKNKG